MTLYQNKYRIESARLKNWDYSSNGAYFITICVRNREMILGNIINGKMVLSEIGEIARKYWQEIPGHFSFIQLDEFVIMPDHIHGIVVMESDNRTDTDMITNTGGITGDKNPMLHDNVSRVIRWYKGRVSFEIRRDAINRVSTDFKWQSRFHDHIIRDDNELIRIREYIINNPANWENDVMCELKADGNEIVTNCHDLIIETADGKMRQPEIIIKNSLNQSVKK